MAQAETQTAVEMFLAPLAALARKHPDIEAEILWARDGTWPADAGPVQVIDSEEICFYAEGMLAEGFAMDWEILGRTAAQPALVRMCFWQGAAAPPPPNAAGLPVLASGDWESFLAEGCGRLMQECAALGNRLFTITIVDRDAGLARRAFTSHPVEYPTLGTKPLTRDAWFDHCIVKGETFVANTPEAFREVFFDHALITSMGLGSAANIPVKADDGQVQCTVNLLTDAGHFSADRIAAYGRIVARYRPVLLALA